MPVIVMVALLRRRRSSPSPRGGAAAAALAAILGACGSRAAVPPRVTDAATAVDPRRSDAGQPDGSTGDDAGPAVASITVYPGPEPIPTLCDKEADLTCTRLRECVPGSFMDTYNDDALCRARISASCRLSLLDPSRRLSPESYATCVADLAKRTCLDIFYGRRPASCAAAPGDKAEGAGCVASRECGPQLTCRFSEGVRCGKCVPALPAGAMCSVTPAECVAGTRCVRDECVVDLKVGEACKRTVAGCAAGLQCTDTGCAERTGDKGAPCDRADICDPTKNLYCNLTTGQCDDQPPPSAGENQGCSQFVEMGYRVRCMPGMYCEPNAGTSGGRCHKWLAAGDACDDTRGLRCAAPAVCSQRVCRIPQIARPAQPPRFVACP